MPFKKGEPRPANSGRKKGTPNKLKQRARDLADEMGVDPLRILLLFAAEDWKALGYPDREKVVNVTDTGEKIYDYVISPSMRVSSAKEAAQYIFPKRKQTDIGEDNKVGQTVADALKEIAGRK